MPGIARGKKRANVPEPSLGNPVQRRGVPETGNESTGCQVRLAVRTCSSIWAAPQWGALAEGREQPHFVPAVSLSPLTQNGSLSATAAGLGRPSANASPVCQVLHRRWVTGMWYWKIRPDVRQEELSEASDPGFRQAV